MNNISGFIQPTMFQQPSVVGIMPQSMPIVATAGGRSDILTMAVVSAVVVIVLFVIYRNMTYNNIQKEESEESEELFKRDRFEGDQSGMDPLTKCGWEVRISPTCPWCVKQKQILSQYFPTFKNIYTDRPAEAVPTWVNSKTGQKVPGMQTHEKLLEMAKC